MATFNFAAWSNVLRWSAAEPNKLNDAYYFLSSLKEMTCNKAEKLPNVADGTYGGFPLVVSRSASSNNEMAQRLETER